MVKSGTVRTLAGLGAVLILLMLVAACGNATEKPTVVFSDLNWDSAQIQTAIARKIVGSGYGYETDAVPGATVPLMEALTKGETNVTLEIWLPNQQEDYDAGLSANIITPVGKSLEDSWQSGFIIPQYVANANPDLKTVQDIRDHMDVFATPDSDGKARLLGCVVGWSCDEVNREKIDSYGLSDVIDYVNPTSGEALDTEIRAAFEKQEPVLFYYWGPTTVAYKLRTQLGGYQTLDEPSYSHGCWDSGKDCAYPAGEVLIVLRTDLATRAPDLVEMFAKWDFDLGDQLNIEAYMAQSSDSLADSVDWFLLNTEGWKNWVTPEAEKSILASLS